MFCFIPSVATAWGIFLSRAPGVSLRVQLVYWWYGRTASDERGEDTEEYQFKPQRIWINDEEDAEDGTFIRDVRIELNIEALKSVLIK